MAYRLVVADVVQVPVKFSVADGGRQAVFAFAFTAPRLPLEEFRALTEAESAETVDEFLMRKVTGWSGQRLVVDEAGEPVAFSAEALRCMLGLVGVAGVMFAAYLQACSAKGKEKN